MAKFRYENLFFSMSFANEASCFAPCAIIVLMKKFAASAVLSVFIFSAPLAAYAQSTILPSAPPDCKVYDENGLRITEDKQADIIKLLKSEKEFRDYIKISRENLSGALGCAIKTGRIRFFMIPFFITFLIQFLLGVAGLVAVLFMVIGGYHYVIGGITEEKEKGKKSIQNALFGLIIALSAWIVVNFIQIALTS